MGYPAAYRQNPRPSHGFQGGSPSRSGNVISGGFERGPNPGKAPSSRGLPYNKNPARPYTPREDYRPGKSTRMPPVAKFRPPVKPKPKPFGKKLPKPSISGSRIRIPGFMWWAALPIAYDYIVNPQPSSFGWNAPAGGWSPVLDCKPNQSDYDAAQWSITASTVIGLESTTCLLLQAFTYAAGNYPFGDPGYEFGDAFRQLTIWDKHRTIPNRWAIRQTFNRPLGTPQRIANFGPRGWEAPAVPQTYTTAPLPRPMHYRPDPTPYQIRHAAKPRPEDGWPEGRSVGAPKPAPGGAIYFWPRQPVTIGTPGTPGIRPAPRPSPGNDPTWLPSISTTIRPGVAGATSEKPQARPHPLRPRAREKKIKDPSGILLKVQAAFGLTTEAMDFINVVWYAIPKKDRLAWLKRNGQRYWSKKHGGWRYWAPPQLKGLGIKDMLQKVDPTQFVRNYVKNQIEDTLYGTMGRADQDRYRKSGSIGGNQTQGNAKWRDFAKDYEPEGWSPTELTDAIVDDIVNHYTGGAPAEGVF